MLILPLISLSLFIVGAKMGIETLIEKIESSSSKNSSISDALTTFGDLSTEMAKRYGISTKVEDIQGYQFALVYKYIIDENKSDRQVFKSSTSPANAKAIDFISGLQKYIYNSCMDMVSDVRNDTSYSADLFGELDLIRKKSNQSLAQSLSTKINRYDISKMLITAVYDALQRGISVNNLGKLFSQSYPHAKTDGYGHSTPLYRQYIDRQKAIIGCKQNN